MKWVGSNHAPVGEHWVLLADCAPVQIAESTRQNIKEAHPRVHTLFVPCGLTGHLQLCDLALCQHFKQQVGGLCASHSAELVTAAIEQADEDEKRANPVAVDTRLSVVKGPFTRWVNDVVTSVLAAVHARAWKHLMPATQKEWSVVVAAASEDFANGCLFKVLETGKGKAEADAFIEEPADAAEVDVEEPSDLLAEEPECAVHENVQEPDEQELLRALMDEQLVATAKTAEQAPAASSSSGTAAQPTDKKRATCRRLAAAGLLRKPPAKGLL